MIRDSRVMIKRIIIWVMSTVMFLAWGSVVLLLNATCERQVVKEYEVGDIVSYGQNYYEGDYEIIDGYKAQVLTCTIYEYENYLSQMNLSITSDSMHSKYIYDLEICFYNDESDGERGVNLISTYLASADNRLAINTNLLAEIYPQLGDSPTEFRIRPGTSMVMHIPFQMEYVPSLYVYDEKEYLYENTFYLNVTQYPIKQVVRISSKQA